jgi:serine/threonine protein kinase
VAALQRTSLASPFTPPSVMVRPQLVAQASTAASAARQRHEAERTGIRLLTVEDDGDDGGGGDSPGGEELDDSADWSRALLLPTAGGGASLYEMARQQMAREAQVEALVATPAAAAGGSSSGASKYSALQTPLHLLNHFNATPIAAAAAAVPSTPLARVSRTRASSDGSDDGAAASGARRGGLVLSLAGIQYGADDEEDTPAASAAKKRSAKKATPAGTAAAVPGSAMGVAASSATERPALLSSASSSSSARRPQPLLSVRSGSGLHTVDSGAGSTSIAAGSGIGMRTGDGIGVTPRQRISLTTAAATAAAADKEGASVEGGLLVHTRAPSGATAPSSGAPVMRRVFASPTPSGASQTPSTAPSLLFPGPAAADPSRSKPGVVKVLFTKGKRTGSEEAGSDEVEPTALAPVTEAASSRFRSDSSDSNGGGSGSGSSTARGEDGVLYGPSFAEAHRIARDKKQQEQQKHQKADGFTGIRGVNLPEPAEAAFDDGWYDDDDDDIADGYRSDGPNEGELGVDDDDGLADAEDRVDDDELDEENDDEEEEEDIDDTEWGISANGTLRLGGFVAIKEGGIKSWQLPSGASAAGAKGAAGSTAPGSSGSGTSKRRRALNRQASIPHVGGRLAGFGSTLSMSQSFSSAAAGAIGATSKPRHIRRELVLLDKLGVGASAVVQRGLHIPSLQLVAVKHVKLFEESVRVQMARELKTLYANIVPLVPLVPLSTTATGIPGFESTMLATPFPLGSHALFQTAGGDPAAAASGAALTAAAQAGLVRTISNASSTSGSAAGASDVPFAPRLQRVSSEADADPLALTSASALSSLSGMSTTQSQLHFSDSLGATGAANINLGVAAAACPYILRLYDAYTAPQTATVSVVIEYCGGGSLQDLLEAGGCDSESALARMAAHVMRGLFFLHSNRQLHRDIKPGNILCTAGGDAYKIADFGIAKSLEEESGEGALARTWVGTMVYMSPERLNSATNEGYSYPSDIWSAGLSLLAVAAGRFPYSESMSYWDLLKAIRDDPAPLSALEEGSGRNAASFSAEFKDFLSLCLQKNPRERPTAMELLSHPWLVKHADERKRIKRQMLGRLASTNALKPDMASCEVGLSVADCASLGMLKTPVLPGLKPYSSRTSEEKAQVQGILDSIVGTLVNEHWQDFTRFYRRFANKKRKKWSHALEETSFNKFLVDRVQNLSATLNRTFTAAGGGGGSNSTTPMNTMSLQQQFQHVVSIVNNSKKDITVSDLKVHDTQELKALDTKQHREGALQLYSKSASSRHPSMPRLDVSGGRDPGAGLSYAELRVDVDDVRMIAAQLGVPVAVARSAFNEAIRKVCEASGSASGMLMTGTSMRPLTAIQEETPGLSSVSSAMPSHRGGSMGSASVGASVRMLADPATASISAHARGALEDGNATASSSSSASLETAPTQLQTTAGSVPASSSLSGQAVTMRPLVVPTLKSPPHFSQAVSEASPPSGRKYGSTPIQVRTPQERPPNAIGSPLAVRRGPSAQESTPIAPVPAPVASQGAQTPVRQRTPVTRLPGLQTSPDSGLAPSAAALSSGSPRTGTNVHSPVSHGTGGGPLDSLGVDRLSRVGSARSVLSAAGSSLMGSPGPVRVFRPGSGGSIASLPRSITGISESAASSPASRLLSPIAPVPQVQRTGVKHALSIVTSPVGSVSSAAGSNSVGLSSAARPLSSGSHLPLSTPPIPRPALQTSALPNGSATPATHYQNSSSVSSSRMAGAESNAYAQSVSPSPYARKLAAIGPLESGSSSARTGPGSAGTALAKLASSPYSGAPGVAPAAGSGGAFAYQRPLVAAASSSSESRSSRDGIVSSRSVHSTASPLTSQIAAVGPAGTQVRANPAAGIGSISGDLSALAQRSSVPLKSASNSATTIPSPARYTR